MFGSVVQQDEQLSAWLSRTRLRFAANRVVVLENACIRSVCAPVNVVVVDVREKRAAHES